MQIGGFRLPGCCAFPRKRTATGDGYEYSDDVPHHYMLQLNAQAEAWGWVDAAKQQHGYGVDLVSELGDQTRNGWLFHCCSTPAHAVYTELGSNWGAFTLPLLRFFGTVYSVDANPDKLVFQSIVAGQSQATSLRFIHSSPAAVPLPGGISDLVLVNLPRLDFCSRVLAAAARPSHTAILAEAHRLLAPRGRICVLACGSVARIRRELSQAGLQHADCYWAWPRADTPRMSGSLDGRSIRYVLRHLSNLMRQRTARRLVQFACHAPIPVLDRVVQSYSPSLIVVAGSSASDVGNGALPAAGSFVRLTLASRPQRGLHTTCLTLRENRVHQAIRIVERGSGTGRATFSSEQTPGVAGRPLRTYVPAETQAAAQWLSNYHKRTFAGYWTPCQVEQEINVLCDNVLRCGPAWIEASLLEQYRHSFLAAIHADSWPIVSEHGDFTPTNILVDRSGQLHVVDWEYCRTYGSPLTDLGAFSLSVLRRTAQQGKLPAGAAVDRRVCTFVSAYSPGSLPAAAFAPAYYVLRWLARVTNPQPGDEVTALYAARSWASLLQPAVAIGLAMYENAADLPVNQRCENP